MRTNQLTGHALNWAVAKAEGGNVYRPRLGRPADWDKEAYLKDGSDDRWVVRVENPKVAHFVDWTYNPSGDWMQGGPIIEREHIGLWSEGYDWEAKIQTGAGEWLVEWDEESPLVAAMRCYVARQLGDEVEIPKELTQGESK